MFAQTIRRLHYKELFLYGAYVTIMVLVLPAAVVDYLIGNPVDAAIDVTFGTLTYGAYRIGFGRHDTARAAVWLFWLVTGFEYIYLTVHGIDVDLIFGVLIPLIAFIVFPRRAVVRHLTVYYLIAVGYIAVGYRLYPTHPYLHDEHYMLALIVAHGFVIAFGVFYMMAVEEFIERLERANHAQGLLLREVHHRVKNNLNLTASILGLQSRRQRHPEAAAVLEENRRRIESMAILHEILYRKDRLQNLDAAVYLHTLTDHILGSEASTPVTITRTVTPIRLATDQLILIGIMVNEMITNTLKHGLDPDGRAQIDLELSCTDTGCCLSYCDHGQAPDAAQLHGGFGYSLIDLTVQQLHARMDVEVRAGLCYRVCFDPAYEEVPYVG